MRNVPSWSKYWMGMALKTSERSKDPATQVGCQIVSIDNKPLGQGYNGFPSGMLETPELWQRPTKYDFVIHAEENSLLNCQDLDKAYKLYCTLCPCKNCARLIAGTKIKKVYYKDHELNGRNYLDDITVDIFKRCGIELIQLKG